MRQTRTSNLMLLGISFAGLVLGILVYAVDRQPTLLSLPAFHFVDQVTSPVFGIFGQFLPSLVHVFSLSILTVLILGFGPRNALIACVSWVMINLAFEIGQHQIVSGMITEFLSEKTSQSFPIRYVREFISNGTFDRLDIFGTMLGGLFAYWIIRLVDKKNLNRQRKEE